MLEKISVRCETLGSFHFLFSDSDCLFGCMNDRKRFALRGWSGG